MNTLIQTRDVKRGTRRVSRNGYYTVEGQGKKIHFVTL